MRRHVKRHPIVHVDPLAATEAVTVYRAGQRRSPNALASCMHMSLLAARSPETGQVANHVQPDAGRSTSIWNKS